MTHENGANGQGPPRLGDVEFSNGAGDTWSVYRHGELVRDDLAFEQVLAIVRGEMAVEDLVEDGGHG